MTDIIQTFVKDCHDYGELGASCSGRCPANYMELDDCPFNKSCEDVTERDWIHIITEELKTYVKE